MKSILIAALLSCLSGTQASGQQATPKEEGFEMKQYYFVMLSKGARRDAITDTAEIHRLQRGHLDNINRLARAGKIVVAGPFGDNGHARGIFIFDAPSREEVEQLLQTDPAIAAGRLDYEIRPWWTAKNCLFQ